MDKGTHLLNLTLQ